MLVLQIDLQIAKQGYRMATWLNTIFGRRTLCYDTISGDHICAGQ